MEEFAKRNKGGNIMADNHWLSVGCIVRKGSVILRCAGSIGAGRCDPDDEGGVAGNA